MKILVCISQVPDTTSKINFIEDNKAFDNQGITYVINPNDEFGLTKSIRLQQQEQAEVVVASVGDASADAILRKCLAIGADRAVRIDTLPQDGLYVAHQLASFAAEEAFDLIITGRESIDYNGGMVGAMLAELLQIPFVTNCIYLEKKGAEIHLEREIDGGKEKLKGEFPLVIGAQKGLVEEKDLIIPNMRGIMQARQKPLTIRAAEELAASSSTLYYEKPPAKGPVKLVDPENLDALIDLLQNEANAL
jgi:electron transfer flavoprotein beta subunit